MTENFFFNIYIFLIVIRNIDDREQKIKYSKRASYLTGSASVSI